MFKVIEPFIDDFNNYINEFNNNLSNVLEKYNQELQWKNMELKQDTLQNTIGNMQGQINSLKNTLINIQTDIHLIAVFVDKISYLATHPAVLWKGIWSFTVESSFWICTFICIGSVILYAIGRKKSAVWAKASLIGYAAIKLMDVALKFTT